MSINDSASLITLQKRAFEEELKQFPSPRHLIVDVTTEPIIRSLFNEDILNIFYTFSLIDSVDRSKDMEQYAIYLLDPYRRYSIDCLNFDYAKGKRYKNATVIFLPGDSRAAWSYLNQNLHFREAFKEKEPCISYSLGFSPSEPHLFVTGAYPSIPAYYSSLPDRNELKKYQITKAVNAMVSICILFNELPVIRYYNSEIASTLAKKLQEELLKYARTNVNFNPTNNRTVFLITDRTMSMFEALCHYDFYRYFVYDFVENMEIEPAAYPIMSYRYNAITQTKEKVESEVTFDSNDEIYQALKDFTLPDVFKGLKKYSTEIQKESERLGQLQELEELEKLWKEGTISPEQKKKLQTLKRTWNVTQTLRDKLLIEQHNNLKSLVNGHINFCNEIRDTKKLTMLREYEAICALFVSAPKDAANLMSPTEGLLQCLSSLGEEDVFDKIRLIIIYAISRGGIIKADMKKLLLFAIPNHADKILANIELMDSIGLQLLKKDLKTETEPRTFFGTRLDGSGTHVNSFVPTYCNIIEKLADKTLSEVFTTKHNVINGYEVETDLSKKTFPYANAGEIPTDDSVAYTFESKLKFSNANRQRPRMYIFAAGGLTSSELSMIGSMEKKINHDIYVGTDQIYSVMDMLGDLNELNSEELKFELNVKMKKLQPPEHLSEVAQPRATSSDKTPSSKHHHLKLHLPGGHNSSVKNGDADGKPVKEKKVKGLFGKFKKRGI